MADTTSTPQQRRGSMRFKAGAWRLDVRAGRTATGTPRWLRETVHEPETDAGEAAAARRLAELVEEAAALVDRDNRDRLTLSRAVEQYREWGETQGKEGPWAPGSIRNGRRIQKLVDDAPIGRVLVAELTSPQFARFYDAVQADHGIWMARLTHGIVAPALERAIRAGVIATNPSRAVSPHGARSKSRRARRVSRVNPKTIARLLDELSVSDADFYTFVRLAAVTGARRSTLAGLRWEDIDLEGGRVDFERAAVHDDKSRDGRTFNVKSLKVDSPYFVQLDPDTLDVLLTHRARQRFDTPWVFPHPTDPREPVRVNRLTDKWTAVRERYPELAATADRKGFRLNDLRHFVATRLLANGLPVTEVAAQLGHVNPQTTVSVYSHVVDDLRTRGGLIMSKELGG